MRKLIGCLVLIAGVGGLGYVATTSHAVRIQSMIGADVQTVVEGAQHELTMQVLGRDVFVAGRVNDLTEFTVLQTAIEGSDGVRVVDMAGVETLPIADPFRITMQKNDAGNLTVAGVMPNETERANLLAAMDAGGDDVTLAAGVPDENWVDVATSGATALATLQSGEVSISNRAVTVTGVAQTPSDLTVAAAAFAELPDGYSLTTQVEALDDGTPLRLSLTLVDGAVDAFGKFPADMQLSEVMDRFAVREDFDIAQSVLPAADPEWPNVVRTGMDALGGLIDASLTIEGHDLRLVGVGSPDGITQAEALLNTLPDTYPVTTDLNVYGADLVLSLGMDWDGNAASAHGIYPSDFSPRGPAGVALTDVGQTLFLPDEDGGFTTNANVGVTALGLLEMGTLSTTANRIILSGVAASPQVAVSMDSILAGAAPDTQITRDFTYRDDGSPAAWVLNYDAQTGAMIEGRLPVGLGVDDLAQSLSVAEISGNAGTALDDNALGNSLDTLAIVSAYLPEIETMTYAQDGAQSELDLVLSPGVDLDLVANDLAERLPSNLAFALSPLEDMPANGTTRTNAATGLGEAFSGGFWLPNFDFETDVEGCTAQTVTVLDRSQIGFLSASARLDATSIRAINALAAVVLLCVDADLTLEVGGHTDSSGDEFENVALSQARAEAVQAALMVRGVPAEAMTAYGFGQSQPIADNETPEGRAANRRTDITWFAAGALRDP